MRAAFYDRKGPARDVLQVGTLPDPQPGAGEVRVRIHASAVNPTDTKARSGWNGDLSMPFPRVIPHQDGAGVIDRVGAGVSAAHVGERVWVYEAQWRRPFGTAAELAVVPAEQAVPLPAHVDWGTGASLGIPAMTAHRCLFGDGAIQGRTVLVAGGAGAVGHAAIQLARWSGARVVATVSRPEQADVARSAGADLVVDRKHENVVQRARGFTEGEGVDRVVEVALEENLELDREVLRPNGVIAAYSSGRPESAPRIPFSRFMAHGVTVHFVLVYTMPREAHAAAAHDIVAALRAGRYRAHVGARFPLEQIAQAHEAQESGKVIGKIILDVLPG